MLCEDAELVQMAKKGDRDAFAMLCERYQRRVWRIAVSLTSPSEAEDLAQDAIVRAWCAIHTCRHEAAFEAWISSIAVNTAYDFRRSWWRRRTVSLADEDESAGDPDATPDAAARRESTRRVRLAVAALPRVQSVAVWLHYLEQFSIAEIARIQNCSESTIRSRIQTGMKRLQFSLSDIDREIEEAPQQCAKGVQI